MKHKIPLSLILCLISLFSSHAENEQEKADSLINKATESLYNNPQQASYMHQRSSPCSQMNDRMT